MRKEHKEGWGVLQRTFNIKFLGVSTVILESHSLIYQEFGNTVNSNDRQNIRLLILQINFACFCI